MTGYSLCRDRMSEGLDGTRIAYTYIVSPFTHQTGALRLRKYCVCPPTDPPMLAEEFVH